MEITEQTILELVRQGAHNSEKLDNTLNAVEALNSRMDVFAKNQKEMHSVLGSKASLLQHQDHETRITALELRQKIKQSWINGFNWLLKRFRDIMFMLVFLIPCLYMIEKRAVMYTFFTSQKHDQNI